MNLKDLCYINTWSTASNLWILVWKIINPFGRVVVALLIWFVIGFLFFYTIETLNLPVVNALTHRHLIFIGRTAGTL